MKKVSIILSVFLFTVVLSSYTNEARYVSTKSDVKFYSETTLENIESHNYKSVSTINPATGDVVFSIPMQSFEFDNSLRQKHFNSKNFLDTKSFPKAKLKAKITNMDQINFEKDGIYNAIVKGELTIKGKTNTIEEKGAVSVKGGQIKVNSTFNVTLADYGIYFEKGKPSTNIAKTVQVTVVAEYKAE